MDSRLSCSLSSSRYIRVNDADLNPDVQSRLIRCVGELRFELARLRFVRLWQLPIWPPPLWLLSSRSNRRIARQRVLQIPEQAISQHRLRPLLSLLQSAGPV